ncbi:DNA polymerase IV [Methylobacterium tarhaniae]|uniref:DNA polymerase IV n=1 Tax=Methylobacterium tarhaniae TaxID=1187852 RepID=A0A0J6TA10_9HYPH|nr:DNA polymerase IV [Methylobacterium tarhaniae]KMO42433.1 DNA polymerase IV [Methylobacterium tarhaniae]
MSGSPLCRDCGASPPADAPRCRACGSPRLLDHPERDALAIAHVDCDAFYAAVEKRDDPSLRDRPLIIGGGRRGVVATACYIARIRGVHSAMPMFRALEACPDAVVLRPDMEKYARVGRQVRAMMQDLTPLVEPVSIDEAFLDLSGTERLHGASPAVTLARFARAVEAEIGITVSVGLAPNKFLAKIASDLEKPRGFSIIGRDEAEAFLAPRPVRILPGIGQAASERLAALGIQRIGEIGRVAPERLHAALGRDALRLLALARGEDRRPVQPRREAKSISGETTFAEDLRAFEALRPVLWRLCETVARRLKRAELAAGSITLKLKDRDFRLRTRTRSGLAPTQVAERLFRPAEALLRESCDGTAYRLIGVGAGDLCGAAHADRGDLADVSAVRDASRAAAIDALRDRFGATAVQRGLGFAPQDKDSRGKDPPGKDLLGKDPQKREPR